MKSPRTDEVRGEGWPAGRGISQTYIERRGSYLSVSWFYYVAHLAGLVNSRSGPAVTPCYLSMYHA